jgi:hypothetical protein
MSARESPPREELRYAPCPHCGELAADLCRICPHCDLPIIWDSPDGPRKRAEWDLPTRLAIIGAVALLAALAVGGTAAARGDWELPLIILAVPQFAGLLAVGGRLLRNKGDWSWNDVGPAVGNALALLGILVVVAFGSLLLLSVYQWFR